MGFSLIVPVPDMIDPRSAGKMLQKVMQEIDRRRYRKVVIDISAVSVWTGCHLNTAGYC